MRVHIVNWSATGGSNVPVIRWNLGPAMLDVSAAPTLLSILAHEVVGLLRVARQRGVDSRRMGLKTTHIRAVDVHPRIF